MLTLKIQNHILEKKLRKLLQQRFNSDSEEMLKEFLQTYTTRLDRLKYSGILKWEKEGLKFQKEVRGEWS